MKGTLRSVGESQIIASPTAGLKSLVLYSMSLKIFSSMGVSCDV